MAEQDQNRNEAATPFRQEEARKQGNVPKSLDVNSFVMLLGGAIALYAWGSSIATKEMQIFHTVLSNAHQASFEPVHIGVMLTTLFGQSIGLLTPVLVLLCVLAVLSNIAQTGPIFSWVPLQPKLERLNPIAGFKRIFSVRLLVEALKTILKFLLLGAVLYYALKAAIPEIMATLNGSPSALGAVILGEGSSILFKLVAALAVVTAIDLAYSRWDFSKKLRMSRRDITDEHKRREGDPRIKSRLRELQREVLKRASSSGRVRDADVLIVNPIHLAVAIKYDKAQIDAPVVIAKGAGILAARMRSLAHKHHVPIVHNKTLARALFYGARIDQVVPDKHYRSLARILVWVFSMRGRSPLGEVSK